MYIFTKKKFYFIFTAVIALTLTIVLVGCNFTTYVQDAKYIIGRVWCFDKITHDQPSKIDEFLHYHSNKGYVNNYHMHSFYGTAL